jgi:hypothetical protein
MAGLGGDDGVGYGRPPRHSRFKPGESGNPRGRPRRPSNFIEDLRNELAEETQSTSRGASITKQRALVRGLVEAAISGNTRALGLLVPVLARSADSPEEDEALSPRDREIIDSYVDREIKRRGAERGNDPQQD